MGADMDKVNVAWVRCDRGGHEIGVVVQGDIAVAYGPEADAGLCRIGDEVQVICHEPISGINQTCDGEVRVTEADLTETDDDFLIAVLTSLGKEMDR